MSGSPIFLTDEQGRSRMIGAFALGWEGTKDAIAGVRPIEEMLAVPADKRAEAATQPTAPPLATAAAPTWDTRSLLSNATWRKAAAGSGQRDGELSAAEPSAKRTRTSTLLRPLIVPLSVNGGLPAFGDLSQWVRSNRFALLESGAAATATTGAEAKLERGSAIGVPIVSGDLDMAAIGTVTEIIDGRVFAFGHEFNGEGGVDLPMGVGYIHTVIPNVGMSFKLGTLLHNDGAIYSDDSVAIAGKIGRVPATIPVGVTVVTPERSTPQTYHYQVTRSPASRRWVR